MDYCHTCRRHLNGALACAGCGTAAAQLAPSPWSRPAPAGPSYEQPQEPELPYGETYAYEIPYAGPDEDAGSRPGRDAGRRRRAAHRRRRRTALTAGTALVCAVAGTMALARLVADDPVSDRAATVVQQQDLGATQPAEQDTAPAGDPSPVPRRTDRPAAGTGEPTGDPSAPVATGDPEPGDPATGAPEADDPEPDAPVVTDRTPKAEHHPGTPGGPGPTGRPRATRTPGPDGTEGPSDPSGGGDGEPDEPDPTPTPEPTEECTPFLWWCV